MNRTVAWSPAANNQFVQGTPTKLELYRIDEKSTHPHNDAILVASVANKGNEISCFEWQNATGNPLLAYGTIKGSVNVVNWEGLFEVGFHYLFDTL